MELAKIIPVIKKHHLMTLATVDSDKMQPWVAHVFYAWEPESGCFVFTSDPATRHGSEMTANSRVAGGIALETRIVGRVQGIQTEGMVRRPDAGAETDRSRRVYLKRFPYAAAAGELSLWLMEPHLVKLTDNTLGFGTKLVWEREAGHDGE